MKDGSAGFVPVIHCASPGRPDEQDTIEVAEIVAASLRRLGQATRVVALGADLAGLETLAAERPAVVFNLVEAVGGDGALAHLPAEALERLGLAYTGSDAHALAATASKLSTKRRLAAAGIPTPGTAGGLMIVKSDGEHASLGIDAGSVVAAPDALAEVARREAMFGGRFFAEAFVAGREFNVAIIAEASGPRVLPIPEIDFAALPPDRPRIVDYEAKWDPASFAYHNTPRRFGLEAADPELAASLGDLALDCWRLFGLSGYARVDFRVDEAGRPFVLEVNANPCLAPDAGFAATAAVAGIGFDAMIGRILADADLHVAAAASA